MPDHCGSRARRCMHLGNYSRRAHAGAATRLQWIRRYVAPQSQKICVLPFHDRTSPEDDVKWRLIQSFLTLNFNAWQAWRTCVWRGDKGHALEAAAAFVALVALVTCIFAKKGSGGGGGGPGRRHQGRTRCDLVRKAQGLTEDPEHRFKQRTKDTAAACKARS